MKLKCKACQKITRHDSSPRVLRKPRLFHLATTGETVAVRAVFDYHCTQCGKIFGSKPTINHDQMKGTLPV